MRQCSEDQKELYDRRNEVVSANLGLVHACAHKFKGKGIEYDDLFQAGCIGIIKAANAFDTGRGVKFSTYAVPVILGEIKRLFRDGGSVKVSRTLKELAQRINRERERFTLEHGREPTISELSAQMGVPEEEIAEAVGACAPVLSLTVGEDGNGGQFDVPVDSPEEEISDFLALRQVIGTLEDADRQLIALRYFKRMTQVRTAELLGMTQVQVSRREKKILAALRGQLNGP